MNKKVLLGLLVIVLAALPLFSACKSTTSTPAQTSSTTVETQVTTPVQTTSVSTVSPTTQAEWWDKFGTPQYGGTLTCRIDRLSLGLDPYSGSWGAGGQYMYYSDFLWQGDWTLNRNTWDFSTTFTPQEYWVGSLAQSWAWTDPTTLTIHLRKDVYWQDKPPTNGREFTAYDVQEHYDRVMGKGNYTKPSPLYAGRLGLWDTVTALDKYTVQFKFTYPSSQDFLSVTELAGQNCIEAPELVKMQGGFTDWHNAVGTGPWILTDYVDGTSVTFTKNPKYWGYDERYPENRLPYADQLKLVVIPDVATSLAALRSGKIDMVTGVNWQQAQNLAKTNPDLEQAKLPAPGPGPLMRVDKAPFNDIRVREALELAIDRKTIAKTHYGGTVDGTPCGVTSPAEKGWDYPYTEWPQSLKDQYAYNPTKAKELLAEAGYPNGFSTNILAAPTDDLELVQIVQSYFKNIGVDMEIKTMDPVTEMSVVMGKKFDQMYWDGLACGRTFIPQMNISGTNSTDMANFGNVQDPNYDALYQKFLHSTDLAESKQLENEAVKYALEQHWVISICPTVTYTITQPYLKGYSGELVEEGRGSLSWLWARLWAAQNTHTSEGQ